MFCYFFPSYSQLPRSLEVLFICSALAVTCLWQSVSFWDCSYRLGLLAEVSTCLLRECLHLWTVCLCILSACLSINPKHSNISVRNLLPTFSTLAFIRKNRCNPFLILPSCYYGSRTAKRTPSYVRQCVCFRSWHPKVATFGLSFIAAAAASLPPRVLFHALTSQQHLYFAFPLARYSFLRLHIVYTTAAEVYFFLYSAILINKTVYRILLRWLGIAYS